MTGANGLAQRRGNHTVRKCLNVKVHQARIWAAFQRIARAEALRGKAAKLHIAILAGKIMQRPLQFHRDANDVRRERRARWATWADTDRRSRVDRVAIPESETICA